MLSNIPFRMSLLKILIFFSTFLIMLLSLLVTPSFAVDSFDYSQHNYTIKSGNMSLKYRDHSRLDKWMTQFDIKHSGIGYAYRYQESKGNVEHRFRKPNCEGHNLESTPASSKRCFNIEAKILYATANTQVIAYQPEACRCSCTNYIYNHIEF